MLHVDAARRSTSLSGEARLPTFEDVLRLMGLLVFLHFSR